MSSFLFNLHENKLIMETKTEKIHWHKVFLSEYLGACDLEEGKDIKVVIKSVSVQEVKGSDGKKQERNVAVFTDPKIKPMILNATNCRIVKKFTGSPYINDWVKVPVQIYIKSDIKAFGDITEGLRIRETQPKMDKPNLTPSLPAWQKAIEYLKGTGTIEGIRAKYELTPENEELLKSSVI
jgi:hypothetical protein